MADSATYISEHTQDFTGREWVFEKIDRWLRNTNERSFLLTGGPGTGKTAIAARLVQMSQGNVQAKSYSRLGSGQLAFFHFCQAFNEDALSPLRFVETLSLALSRCLPGFAEVLLKVQEHGIRIDAVQEIQHVQVGSQVNNVVIRNLHIDNIAGRAAFERVIRHPLKVVYEAGLAVPVVLLIDSLDEALTYGEDNIATLLAKFIDHPDDLPPQVRFIFTSRPDPKVQAQFGEPTLDLIKDAPVNVADVKSYVIRRLHGLVEPRRSALAGRVAEESQGVFLYARYVLDDLVERTDLPEDLADLPLPKELNGVYRDFLRRELSENDENWGNRYQPLLGLLAVSRNPGLSRDHLIAVSEMTETKVDYALKRCIQYLSGPLPDGPFTLFHQSFREFLLTSGEFQVYPANAERDLGKFFVKAYERKWHECQDEYAILNTPSHLISAIRGIKRVEQRSEQQKLAIVLTKLLMNQAFQTKKSRLVGVQAIQLDILESRVLIKGIWNYLRLLEAERRLMISQFWTPNSINFSEEPDFGVLTTRWNNSAGATVPAGPSRLVLMTDGRCLVRRQAILTSPPTKVFAAIQKHIPQSQTWHTVREIGERLRRFKKDRFTREEKGITEDWGFWIEVRTELLSDGSTYLALLTASSYVVDLLRISETEHNRAVTFIAFISSWISFFPFIMSVSAANVVVSDLQFAVLVQELTGSQQDAFRAATIRKRYHWLARFVYLICILATVSLLALQKITLSEPLPTDGMIFGLYSLAFSVNLVLWQIAKRYHPLPGRWAPGAAILESYARFGVIVLIVLWQLFGWVPIIYDIWLK